MVGGHDVAVIGGGPAGAAAALTLRAAGRRVVVLEKSRYHAPRVGETLPPAVKSRLVALGIWERFLESAPARSPAIQSAWGGQRLREQNHFFHPHGTGWHVDRSRFDALLADAAEEAGAAVHRDAHVTGCEPDRSGLWNIRVRGRAPVRARFVLDATGRSSGVARQLGARRIRHDNLIGVVGLCAGSFDSPTTLVEAAEDGWWYSAMLPDARLVVAFMTDPDLFASGTGDRTARWLSRLDQTLHTRARVGAALLASQPLVAPAHSSRLDSIHGAGWLAVGDAASAFDPISGHGVHRALESGMRAGAAVHTWFEQGDPPIAAAASASSAIFDRFLALRSDVYRGEARWPDAIFWRRRATEEVARRRTPESRDSLPKTLMLRAWR